MPGPASKAFLGSAERALSRANLEAGGGPAAQDSQSVQGVGALQLHRGNLGFGGRELGLGLGDVEVGGDAAFAAVLVSSSERR